MIKGKDGTSVVLSEKDIVWNAIKHSFVQRNTSPVYNLQLGQRYARQVADELLEDLIFFAIPPSYLSMYAQKHHLYAVKGTGFPLGEEIRSQVHLVDSPHRIPANAESWVVLRRSEGRVMITANYPQVQEYMDARIASQNSPMGRRTLVQFLHGESIEYAGTEGETIFSSNGILFHRPNMFSHLLDSIQPLVNTPQRRSTSHSEVRRGHLVLV